MRYVLFILLLSLSSTAQAELLYTPTARGLSCLHCMADQKQAKHLCNVLFHARLKQNILPVLIDGSFGFNPWTLIYCIDLLTHRERELTMHYYVHSGPGQRRCITYKRHKVPGWASGVCAVEFNQRILVDTQFQESYKQHLRNRAFAVGWALARGAKVNISWLEDNMSDAAFNKVLELTREVFGHTVTYVRNPVYSGKEIPPGLLEELHTFETGLQVFGGVVFNDGEEIVFDYESPRRNHYSMQEMTDILHQAEEQGNAFILWNGRYQGSGHDIPLKRKYKIPTIQEAIHTIQFLRQQ